MQHIYHRFDAGRTGVALLLLRLISGVAFILHGWPRVTGLAGFAQHTQLLLWLAGLAAYREVIGGALLILGFLTPLAALFIGVAMAVAIVTVHLKAGDPFVYPVGRSFETAAVYLVLMTAFLLAGPGADSLDAMLMQQRDVEATRAPGYTRRRGLA